MSATSYPPDLLSFLQMTWGAGFLSPGGPEEVRKILKDIPVKGKTILDIGCGLGGPDMVIARDMAPARIVSIDVEAHLVEQARANLAGAGLGHLVEARHVDPGPLPFEDAGFDIVFSKDSLIHIADMDGLYAEVLRVLKPGGRFAASDWLRSADAFGLEGFTTYLATTSHTFNMQTPEEAQAQMTAAGFADVHTRDRAEWYAALSFQEVDLMQSDDWKSRFIAAFGEDAYAQRLKLKIANTHAADCGGLRPTHVFGTRPA